ERPHARRTIAEPLRRGRHPRAHPAHAAGGPRRGGGPPRPPRHPPPRRRPRSGYALLRVGGRGGPARRLPRPRDDGGGDADAARHAPPLRPGEEAMRRPPPPTPTLTPGPAGPYHGGIARH